MSVTKVLKLMQLGPLSGSYTLRGASQSIDNLSRLRLSNTITTRLESFFFCDPQSNLRCEFIFIEDEQKSTFMFTLTLEELHLAPQQ